MESPIFVLGAHKSGTSLLRALFDGHKDLFVVPIESHYFKHLGWWIQYPFRKQLPKYRTVREFWYEAKQWIIHCNMVEDRLSDSMMAGKFNIQKIDEYLERLFEISTPDEEVTESIVSDLYYQYVEFIHFSLYTPSSLNEKRIVEKSVENFEFAVDIEQGMPNCKFIHIVRNPYSNLVSLRKYVNRSQKSYPNLGIPLRVISDSFYHLEKNKRIIGEQKYFIVKYEDLVLKPQIVMADLANFLDLEFTESLLFPTSLGKKWKGNSTVESEFQAVSSSRLESWKLEINHLEIELINKVLSEILDKYGYAIQETHKNLYIPVMNEKPIQYCLNRMLARKGLI